jgi:diguanylate cyclase (GGDEF)-like protein
LENLKLQRLVVTDYLTGLYVLRYLIVRLEMELEHSHEKGNEFCLSMIDIDYFKKINDQYGHEKGNEVLVAVARTLKNSVRGVDAVARYGGDEFAIIFMDESEKDAVVTMEKIHAAVRALQFSDAKGDFTITLSCGICSNRHPAVKDSEDMIRLADEALYDSKSKGRNRVSVSRPPETP